MVGHCLNDETLGPAVIGCRGDFDFTQGFAAVVLSIIPVGVFHLLAFWCLSSWCLGWDTIRAWLSASRPKRGIVLFYAQQVLGSHYNFFDLGSQY